METTEQKSLFAAIDKYFPEDERKDAIEAIKFFIELAYLRGRRNAYLSIL